MVTVRLLYHDPKENRRTRGVSSEMKTFAISTLEAGSDQDPFNPH